MLLDTSAAAVGHNQIAQGCLSRNYTTQIAFPGGLTYERCSLSSLSSKSYSGITRKVLEPKGQVDREFIAIVQCEMVHHSSPFALPSTVPTIVNKSTVRGSRQGQCSGGKTAVLFSVLILFPLFYLLLLTPVIYGGHPSSGCVHQLLVARQSWQQLCIVRGIWLSYTPAVTLFPPLPPPKNNSVTLRHIFTPSQKPGA